MDIANMFENGEDTKEHAHPKTTAPIDAVAKSADLAIMMDATRTTK
jgi:hypothetical protein